MPLTGLCPACGAEAPLEAYLADAEAREALGALLALLPERERRIVPRYAALFGPPKQRLRWPKLTRVLRDLAARIESGTVTRHGQARTCTRAHWLAAMEACVRNHEAGTLATPLADHAYLDAIAWDEAGAPPGRYTAPTPAAPPSPAAPALSPAQRGAELVGLRRMAERLAAMGQPVPEGLRAQIAAAGGDITHTGDSHE
jgi:hypothetical protein